MGSYRFRFSDMIPNAWFYKLKDMGRPRNHSNADPSKEKQYQISPPQPSKIKQPHQFYPRKSYYFTRELIPIDGFYVSPTNTKSTDGHFPEPSRKSCKKRPRKRNIRSTSKLVTSSVSADCSCRDTIWSKDDSPPDYSASLSSSSSSDDGSSSPQEFRSDCILSTESFDNMASWSRSCSTCKVMNSKANDIAIDADNESFVKKFDKLDELDNLSELELPPIITKPAKFNDMVKGIKNNEPTKCRRSSAKFAEKITHDSLSVKVVKEERITVKENNKNTSPVRKFSVNSPGVRLRINSPKIASRRIQGHGHGRKSMSSSSSSSSSGRSLSGSFAVVKSSFDPQRDFRDSMVEMIMENNIRASKDLEDLLACYLSLNSDEYHDLIIKVFKQIWFDLSDVQLK